MMSSLNSKGSKMASNMSHGDDDDSDDEHYEHNVEDHDQQDDSDDDDNPSGPSGSKKSGDNGATPIQKRRRVTRACDECRRKKIKCDGKQPCTHCTVYSYECTYDQPSNRRRNPAPFYINQLESRLQQSTAMLQILMPGVDIFTQGFDINSFTSRLKSSASPTLRELALAARQAANGQVPHTEPAPVEPIMGNTTAVLDSPASISSTSSGTPATSAQDTNIESMVVSLGRLDVDETGHLDYVGHSSGRAFLQHVRARFLNNHPDAIPADLPKQNLYATSPVGNTPPGFPYPDSPSDLYYYQQMAEFKVILPSKEVADTYINAVYDQAFIITHFAHRPSFTRRVEELYATDPDDYTPTQISFLPLVYCYLAVGVLFGRDTRDPSSDEMIDFSEGYMYFVAARNMMDITDARDTDAIQAVGLMVVFLQTTARLSTCYSYIGVALRAALRLGLHRKVSYRFNPIEAEVRKRLFWAIYKMDIHISAMLGLPRCISEDEIDQEQPLEIDDEYITETKILPHPVGTMAKQTVGNQHTKLMAILTRIVEDVYPVKFRSAAAQEGRPANSVSYAKVVELENDLQTWLDALPMELRPGVEPPPQWLQANRLLNMAFCYVKIILYRPFIHYVGQKYRSSMTDQRPYACAANCISTARIVVHLADDLIRRDVLRGAHLFSVYTIFFSAAVLVYYVHEDPYNPHVKEFLRDAELGKTVINHLKGRSTAAARTYELLSGLFQLLDQHMATIGVNNILHQEDTKRKRQTDGQPLYRTASGTMIQRTFAKPSMMRFGNNAQQQQGSTASGGVFMPKQRTSSMTSNSSDKSKKKSVPSASSAAMASSSSRQSSAPPLLPLSVYEQQPHSSNPVPRFPADLKLPARGPAESPTAQMPTGGSDDSPMRGLSHSNTFPVFDQSQSADLTMSSPDNMSMNQGSYDDFLMYTDSMNKNAVNYSPQQPGPLDVDISEMSTFTSSNIDTTLYFPSLGDVAQSGDETMMGQSMAPPMNSSADAQAPAPVNDITADFSSYDGLSLDGLIPSTEKYASDKLEAQMFGRYFPSYTYGDQKPQETSPDIPQVVPQPQEQRQPAVQRERQQQQPQPQPQQQQQQAWQPLTTADGGAAGGDELAGGSDFLSNWDEFLANNADLSSIKLEDPN
ncbi:fungal-specific transcription factor domain-containing protein [Myxozyma melibiosi]|uniref:Fungal-specific transcription factor domain-containing protein n=1 Tax=Myxozyma melibiosi TaxID=54550 RepID=A0ABR1FEC9_9ASCO